MHKLLAIAAFVVLPIIQQTGYIENIKTYLPYRITFWVIIYAENISTMVYDTISKIKLEIPKLPRHDKQENIAEKMWSFLQNNNGFPVKEAMRVFGMTTRQHKVVGDMLENYGFLIRGENNARILNSTALLGHGSYTILQTKEKLQETLEKAMTKA